MEILFNLDYRTSYGERLKLVVVDNGQPVENYEMASADGEHWVLEMTRSAKTGTFIDYYYSVCNDQQELRHEWLAEPHRLEFADVRGTHYTVYDHWLDIP